MSYTGRVTIGPMQQCPGCSRHLFVDEQSCPFCGAALRTVTSRSSLAAIVLGVALTACGGSGSTNAGDSAGEDTGESSTTSDTGGTETGETGTETDTGDTSSESDSADTDDAPGSFYAGATDMGPNTFCDVWAEDDCPDGEKCTATSGWYFNECRQILGDGQPGDECTIYDEWDSGDDDCGAGALCWGADPDTKLGVCVELCSGSPDDPVCSGDNTCFIFNNGFLPVCVAACDPLMAGADCPIDGELCVNAEDGEGFACVPGNNDLNAYGEPCDNLNSCEAGLICTEDFNVPGCDGDCCTQYCAVGSPETCPDFGDGQDCVPYFEMGMAPDGYEDVGVCSGP